MPGFFFLEAAKEALAVRPTIEGCIQEGRAQYEAERSATNLGHIPCEADTLWHKVDHLLYLPILGLTRPRDLYYYQGEGLQVQTPLYLYGDWHAKPHWSKQYSHSGHVTMWGRVMPGTKQLLLSGPDGYLLGGWNYPIDTVTFCRERELEKDQLMLDFQVWNSLAGVSTRRACAGAMVAASFSRCGNPLDSSYLIVKELFKPHARGNDDRNRTGIEIERSLLFIEPAPLFPASGHRAGRRLRIKVGGRGWETTGKKEKRERGRKLTRVCGGAGEIEIERGAGVRGCRGDRDREEQANGNRKAFALNATGK